jgi:4-alpha-glucanotransferase
MKASKHALGRPMLLTPERPIAGLLAPLFALRHENDLGIGDICALREFIDWAAESGFRLVQLLPINETGNDHSPYNAISSVALDPTTIEIRPGTIPDLTEDDLAEMVNGIELRALRAGHVAYPIVKSLKVRLLERAFEHFAARSWKKNDSRAKAFRAFCEGEKAWIEDYSLFRVLIDENNGTERWDTWPEQVQTAAKAHAWLAAQPAPTRDRIHLAQRKVKYWQWVAWTQWRELKRHAESKDVALMGDIPFGVSYYSADCWANPEIFDLDWCGGCPPERILQEVDAFTKKWGQNWGIPLYRWDVVRKRKFDWWRQRVRKVRDVFHLFRIDHVLGVFRIYGFPWRPHLNAEFLPLTDEEAAERTKGRLPHFVNHDDDTPQHKAANCAQGEEILSILLEECGEFRLVGEDLGVVPDYVRPCLRRLNIAGFKIPQWENEPNGSMIAGTKYERLSLATFATHDHEPLRAMWQRWMNVIEAAEHGGPETRAERDKAWRECRAMAGWCGFEVPRLMPWSDKVHEKLLAGLLHCNSWITVLMITDLFATTQRFNIPGAVSELNWSQRLQGTPAEWRTDAGITAKLERVREMMEMAGR